MSNEIFKKYYNKLAREGIVKGLLCGLIIGLALLFIMATSFWFFGYQNTLVLVLAFVVVTAAATVLFYHFKFRPTTKSIAKRVDALGLEERLLTMHQLEGDTSYIAMRQREDALKALSKLDSSLLKWAVSIPLIVATCICGVVGLGMTGVYTAYALDAIDSGMGIISDAVTPDPQAYYITYAIEGYGKIELVDDKGNVLDWMEVKPDIEAGQSPTLWGNDLSDVEAFWNIVMGNGQFQEDDEVTEDLHSKLSQKVFEGQDARTVRAMSNSNYFFLKWSDGVTSPTRNDLEVMEDKNVTAIFVEVIIGAEDFMDPNKEGEPDSDKGGKPNPNAPPNPNQKPSTDAGDDSEGAGEGAGKNISTNQYKDGNTYYGDEAYDQARNDAADQMNQDSNISQGEKDFVNGYLDAIEK